MFSGFRTPTLVNRGNINQENNVSSRKPGQLSARKPFSERSNIDIRDTPTPIVKPQVFIKPVIQNEPEIDMSMHVMTFKNIKDNYNDIYNEEYFLGRKGLKNIYRHLLDDIPTEKPVYNDTVEFIPIEREEVFESNDKFDDICNVLNNEVDFLNIDDVPFPDLELDF